MHILQLPFNGSTTQVMSLTGELTLTAETQRGIARRLAGQIGRTCVQHSAGKRSQVRARSWTDTVSADVAGTSGVYFMDFSAVVQVKIISDIQTSATRPLIITSCNRIEWRSDARHLAKENSRCIHTGTDHRRRCGHRRRLSGVFRYGGRRRGRQEFSPRLQISQWQESRRKALRDRACEGRRHLPYDDVGRVAGEQPCWPGARPGGGLLPIRLRKR
ncbi:hypothetical protein CUJ84_Chr000321 [Rhizobium leguminosarum]|uniref:Uncharacterized protein n=1 Tax=Rhizobium leguminosarum TaxID=384 RepID=A0A2K9YXP9_RHILE|nr:hypothetical protein CUJ84_Chr000321 [Rhizobium leguminosarum]